MEDLVDLEIQNEVDERSRRRGQAATKNAWETDDARTNHRHDRLCEIHGLREEDDLKAKVRMPESDERCKCAERRELKVGKALT